MEIRQRPQGSALVVFGNLNNDLAAPEGQDWDKGMEVYTEEEGLEGMSGHFLPFHKLCLKYVCTWAMHQGGRGVRSRTDYILGTDSYLFQNVVVWDV